MNGPAEDWDLNLDEAHLGVGEVTDLMDRAAILSQRDPWRRGNVMELPAEGDLVILGDLHGDRENLDRVLGWARLHRHRDRCIVFQELIHGGPADEQGGDSSFWLLEEVASLKCIFRSRVQVVLSNHDLAELTGSRITKAGEPVSDQFRRGVRNAYGPNCQAVLEAYRRFLAALPLAVSTPNGLFISHSTPEPKALEDFDYSIFDRPLVPGDYRRGTSLYEMVWGRNHNQRSADEFARAVGAQLLITGHQSSLPGIKTPTSRHMILTSDGRLGSVLVVPLNRHIPQRALARQVLRIRSLRLPSARRRAKPSGGAAKET
ncbi:MAG: hypothetical protein WBD63_01210 [Phycisphaerae bacterium]|nr:hypothetical protein [Phycisphaerae bacterium]